MQPKVAMLPLFQELHKRLGYSEWYLVDLKSGHRPPTRRFKLTASGILNRPVEDLFGGEDETNVQELSPPADSGGLDDSPLPH